VEVKESSGFPVLDRAAVDFVKRHWRLPDKLGQPVCFKPASPTNCNFNLTHKLK
jgi:outer membrane biosynthesis protein TonB